MQYPRVLIISHNSLSKTSNNGKTIASLFSRWPRAHIAQIYICSRDVPDFELCNHYYHITDMNVLRGIFNRKQNIGGRILRNAHQLSSAASNQLSSSAPDGNLITWIKSKSYWFEFLRDMVWQLGFRRSPDLDEWIKEFSPDAVFFVGGPYEHSHKLARDICREYHLPLYVYFTDDYVVNRIDNRPWTWLIYANRRRFYKLTISAAKACFVIGEYMAAQYGKFYGRSFVPIMNTVPIYEIPEVRKHDKTVISFIGGIHLNRWRSLVHIGEIINKIVVKKSIPVELNIYCAQEIPKKILVRLNRGCMRFCGKLIGESEVRAAIDASDILLHVESMDKKSRILTNMSISTKIPEYLISGRCVVAYGPHEIASIRLIANNAIGVAITDNDSDEELEQTLEKVLSDESLRHEFGLAGHRYCLEHFTIDKVLNRFESFFD